MAVFLTLDKAPIAGEPVTFNVKVINKQNIAKNMKVHLNAQAKEYNHSPLDTFWETHGIIQLAPMEGTLASVYTVKYLLYLQNYCGLNSCLFFPSVSPATNFSQQILPAQYEDVVGDNLINLAVILEDVSNQERVLASEEFNITSPELSIQVLQRF